MKVYIAGPDVFRADAKQFFDNVRAVCKDLGITPLIPLDNDVKGTGETAAGLIYAGNIAMIEEADAIVANISAFRGVSCDPGTAFEIGFAAALKKRIALYSRDTTQLKQRTERHVQSYTLYPLIEDFGLAENLMIVAGGAIPVRQSLPTALGDLLRYPRAA